MPTPFAIVLLGVLAVAAVAGVVLWALRTSRGSSSPSTRGSHSAAPWDEHTAAAQQMRMTDRGGGGL